MKDYVDGLHGHNLCLKSRTMTFFEEITPESAHRFIKNLHLLDNDKQEKITIKFSSEGGCVISGFMMYDAIKACKNYVRIIIYGECSSMGTVVMQAADERFLMPNSFLMIHFGIQTIEGHPKSNENWLMLYKELDTKCNKIYLEKINIRQVEKKKRKYKLEQLDKMLDFDTILLPKKAVSLGLADKILENSY